MLEGVKKEKEKKKEEKEKRGVDLFREIRAATAVIPSFNPAFGCSSPERRRKKRKGEMRMARKSTRV